MFFLGLLLVVSAFSANILSFSRASLVPRRVKILGVWGGFPWVLRKHQGMEDQGQNAPQK